MGFSLGSSLARTRIRDGDAFFGIEPVDHGGWDDELTIAGVKRFVIDFLIFKIFGDDAQGIGLDAGVDVLGDEDRVFAFLREVPSDGDDAIVRLFEIEARDGFAGGVHGDLDGAAVSVPFDAVVEMAVLAEVIDVADGGACGAADVGRVLFELVELLEHVKRDDDVVVGEGKKRAGVMEQDVGVQDEIFHGRGGGG